MRILLVDDNEISLELQKLMIESCKITVDTASNGQAAIDYATNSDYNLIFMDINMPQMDGYEAARRIREFDKETRIIALSADEISDDDERFKKSGMNSAVLKPLDRQTLQGIIAEQKLTHDMGTIRKRKKDVVFDYQALRQTLKTSGEVLQVLQQFLDLHHNDCDRIRESLAADDFISARKILHNIIGISGNLNCMQLYNMSVKLSSQLKSGKYDCLDEFTEVWRITVGELSEQSGRLLASFHPEEDAEDWETLLHDFLNACEDFDVSAARIFNRNRERFERHLGHEESEILRKAVTSYDFIFITDNKERFNV